MAGLASEKEATGLLQVQWRLRHNTAQAPVQHRILGAVRRCSGGVRAPAAALSLAGGAPRVRRVSLTRARRLAGHEMGGASSLRSTDPTRCRGGLARRVCTDAERHASIGESAELRMGSGRVPLASGRMRARRDDVCGAAAYAAAPHPDPLPACPRFAVDSGWSWTAEGKRGEGESSPRDAPYPNCGRAIISQRMASTAAKAGKPEANQVRNRRW